MDAEGGVPRRLTNEPSSEGIPAFSRDGRSVYFSSDRDGRQHIWRRPLEGGPAVRVARTGAGAVESHDANIFHGG